MRALQTIPVFVFTALICGWSCASPSQTSATSGSSSSNGASTSATSSGAGGNNACPTPSAFDPAVASEILVAGDSPTMGIFDPSFVSNGTSLVMAYSAVPDQETIRTHIALSSDQGASWSLGAEINTPDSQTVPSSDATECPGGSCSGAFISEVPTLVFDADEPDSTKAWKLFAHRYLVGPNVALHYRIGTISLQTAPAPQGPWTAPSKLIGWTSPAPYSSTGVTTNVNALPGMSDCVLLTEPGALWQKGELDLAVGCAYAVSAGFAIRIELLRSTDHAASWNHVGTLLRPDDAGCSPGATGLNAVDLFESGGAAYLSATPGDSKGTYEGCSVFRVDLAKGGVERDAAGHAVPIRSIVATTGQFSGACTFADGAGYAIDVGFLNSSTQRKFRITRPGFSSP